MLFGNFCAYRLRYGEVVIELLVTATQGEGFRGVFLNPFQMIATRIKAMTHDRNVFVETIERQRHFRVRLIPIRLTLVLISVVIKVRASRHSQIVWWHRKIFPMLSRINLYVPIG